MHLIFKSLNKATFKFTFVCIQFIQIKLIFKTAIFQINELFKFAKLKFLNQILRSIKNSILNVNL